MSRRNDTRRVHSIGTVHHTHSAQQRAGFTLIELLVVIAIIGTLSLIVGPTVYRHVGDARSTAARNQIEILVLALETYRQDVGAFPTTEQGVAALRTAPAEAERMWRGPYLRRPVPFDPWNRPYVYVSPGTVNPTMYDLYTLGRDGAEGGTDEDADITSWGADSAKYQVVR